VVNPFSKADWEGVGVEPDVKVKAEDALKTAERLAVVIPALAKFQQKGLNGLI